MKKTNNLLETKLRFAAERLRAKTGFSVRNLKTGYSFSYNGGIPCHAASMIKLPILSCFFKFLKEGKLSPFDKIKLSEKDMVDGGVLSEMHDGLELELMDLARLMIVVSDNTASNILTDILGIDALNEHISDIGMKNTSLVKKLMLPPSEPGLFNRTSADDVSLFFNRLYFEDLVSPEADREMKSILSRQMFREKIPRRLPLSAFIANKTGEVSNTRHDGALIVYGTAAYSLCVLVWDAEDVNDADDFISEISKLIFDDFTV